MGWEEKIFNSVEIELNEYCNMSCSYCPNSSFERIEKGDMGPEVFNALLGQLKEMNYNGKVSLHFYGEPLMSPQLEERIIDLRRELPNVCIEIYSNGILLTEEKLNGLIEAGLSRIIITKHKDSFSGPFEFDEVFEKLSITQKSYVIYKGFEDINLTNRGGLVDIEKEKKYPSAPCYIPSTMLVVTLKGNIIPCFEDYFQKHEMGNILKKNLLEIWNTDIYKKYRRDLRLGLRTKFDVCKDCNRVEALPLETEE